MTTVYFLKVLAYMFSVHVNRMLAIRDGYGQKSESAFQFLNRCPYSCVGA